MIRAALIPTGQPFSGDGASLGRVGPVTWPRSGSSGRSGARTGR